MKKNSDRAKHVTPKVRVDSGLFESSLLIRLVLASLVFAAALVIKMPDFVSMILLALAAVVAGYDIVIQAVNAAEARDFFATPLVLVVIAVLSYVIGFGIEGASLVILYQIGLLLMAYVEDRTKRTAIDFVRYQDEETVTRLKLLLAEDDACSMELEDTMRFCAGRILKLAMLIAVVYAVVLPLFTSYSYTVSIHRALTIILISTPFSVVAAMPLAAYVAMCYSAQEGMVFNRASVMEHADRCNVAVFDKTGVFASDSPRVIQVKSDVLDQDTFMDFVAHALYYSEQPVAKAVSALGEQEYKLDVISDFEEIPGVGVRLKIGGADVSLAVADYYQGRGVELPEEALPGQVFYLVVSQRFVGMLSISADINTENAGLCEEMKAVGVGRCVLLTEDSNFSSQRAAEELDFSEFYGELSAEKKMELLSGLSEGNNRLLYIYSEGVESHTAAQVDVRVGRKSRFADAIVLPESISNIPFGLQVCRRLREVATVNAVFMFVVKALLIFLSIVGYCNIWFAIFIDMAAAIGTQLNTIRVTQNSLINTYRYKAGKN